MSRAPRLTRERIVLAAVAVADRGGLSAVSMRSVGRELGVEAMSLYHHITGKDELVDAMVDRVFGLIELPAPDETWRAAMFRRASSARAVLTAHPWALGILESRHSPGPTVLRYHDAILGTLRRGGFSVDLAGNAFSALDAYVFGFVLTEINLPFEPGQGADDFVDQMNLPVDDFPYLAEFVAEKVVGREYAYGSEFDFGLDLILDALEARLGELGEGGSGLV